MSRRVVVTGVGLLCPVGNGTEQAWQALKEGRGGIGPITRFDAAQFACRIAGEVRDFDPTRFIEKKEVRRMARFMHFAVAASEYALAGPG